MIAITVLAASLLVSPEAADRVAWGSLQKDSDVAPAYPRDARSRGLVELVFLDVVVEKDGAVGDVVSLRGARDFAGAAAAAVRQWRFRPVMVGGAPTRVTVTMPIGFSLEGRSLLGPAKDALRDPREHVRAAAAEYLGRLGRAAKAALRELHSLQSDASALVREAAERAIAKIDSGNRK